MLKWIHVFTLPFVFLLCYITYTLAKNIPNNVTETKGKEN